jgi:hypothetical protein
MIRKVFYSIIILTIIGLGSCKKDTSDDTTPPVITLTGPTQVYVEKGTSYNDAGATANDETDGDITSEIVVYNPVDINTIGTYYVTYNVSDKAGNEATEVRRKVEVKIF